METYLFRVLALPGVLLVSTSTLRALAVPASPIATNAVTIRPALDARVATSSVELLACRLAQLEPTALTAFVPLVTALVQHALMELPTIASHARQTTHYPEPLVPTTVALENTVLTMFAHPAQPIALTVNQLRSAHLVLPAQLFREPPAKHSAIVASTIMRISVRLARRDAVPVQ